MSIILPLPSPRRVLPQLSCLSTLFASLLIAVVCAVRAMDFSNIKDQVSNLTLYDIKAGVRKVQNGKSSRASGWNQRAIHLSSNMDCLRIVLLSFIWARVCLQVC